MTIKEVARLAGVSPAAVSRYLNGGPLSPQKRKSIADAIQKTGYRPNKVAQTMRTGRVNLIGVIVPRINSESVSQILNGISDELSSRNYLTVIVCSDGLQEKETQYINILQDNRVAGIILMGVAMNDALHEAIAACTIPVVVTGQKFEGLPCVYHDDHGAMSELTKRMIDAGRRKIAYIGVREDDVAAGLMRRLGVRETLESAGLGADNMPYTLSTFDAVGGYAGMRQLLEKAPDIDGVLCATDAIALGAMRALRESGRRIPEDVSITGIGGSWMHLIPQPALTTMHYQYYECGTKAVQMMLSLIEEGDGRSGQNYKRRTDHIILDYQFIEGGSL